VGGYVINMGQIRREPLSGPALLSVVLALRMRRSGEQCNTRPHHPHLWRRRAGKQQR
jgi:hypothetical protein